MKQNLLVKVAVTSALVAGLSACGGGTDKGYDTGYKKTNDEVSFETDYISAQFEEESGIQTVDLLEGAVAGGEPLASSTNLINISQMEFVAEGNFETPQSESNTIPTHTISPFVLSEDTRQLIIDTDAFAESLRACDDTDERGATDDDGRAIADGNPDYPSQVVYEITYTIDNGYQYPAGESLPERTLMLTIDAINDPVTGVNIAPLELPAGGQAQVIASTLPTYACNQELTYSSDDETIATVDETGLVTGESVGVANITATSVENPEAAATDTVTVTAAFSIAITNQDLDDLDAPTGHKQIPACVAAGIEVEPSTLNHELNGVYGYDWTITDDANFAQTQNAPKGFGALLALLSPADIGATTPLEVALASGDTGATPISEVAPKSIDVTVINNKMCDPGESEHAAGWIIDFGMDYPADTLAYNGNASFAPSLETVSGSPASVQITAGAGVAEDGSPYSWGAQQPWNKQRNWYSATYGQGLNSVGKKYRYGVWVKLNEMPTEPVTLRQVIVAWKYEGLPPDASGFPGRYGEAGIFSAQLEATTEWQYLELVDDKTGERDWAVPSTWNMVTDVFTLWEVYGLPQGNSILLDDYSVTHVDLLEE